MLSQLLRNKHTRKIYKNPPFFFLPPNKFQFRRVADRRWRLKMNPAAFRPPFLAVLFLLAAALRSLPLAGARLQVAMTVVRNASSVGACKWNRYTFSSFTFLWWNLIGFCFVLHLEQFVWTAACRRTTSTGDSAPEPETGFYSSRSIISLQFNLNLYFAYFYFWIF